MHFSSLLRGSLGVLAFCAAGVACSTGEGEEEAGSEEACETDNPCADDTDCDGGTRCNVNLCTRLFCLDDSRRCESDEVCESRQCVLVRSSLVCWSGPRPENYSCESTGQCESGLTCVSFRCTADGSLPTDAVCSNSDQCQAGLFCRKLPCDEELGLCARPLGDDELCCKAAECASDLVCRASSCSLINLPSCLPPSGVDQPCCQDTDCQSSLECSLGLGVCRPGTAGGVLTVEPASVEFTMVEGAQNPPPATVTIGNSGTDPLNFQMVSRPAWLSVDPTEGDVPPGGQVVMTLSADGTDYVATLPYTGTLNLLANTAIPSFALRVTLTVTQP